MADRDDPKDVFKQFSDSTVEQVANVAQLAAEARRLGLIPEFPRELVEKLDVGGTLLDLFRLQLKHTTALASILGPQARNLEKLNHWSALISTSKSSAPRRLRCKDWTRGVAKFELSLDNPVDRTQKLSVSLTKLRCIETGESREFVSHEVVHEGRQQSPERQREGAPIVWQLSPPIDEIEPHELRSCWITFGADGEFDPLKRYETTALVRLSPLGSMQRYQLYLDATEG